MKLLIVIGWILLGLVALVLLLILAAVLRTLFFIPEKKSTFVPEGDPERAAAYGEKLSKMVQVETVSVRGEIQREKFLGFHKVLEELFPLLHEHLEKVEIDGSLLYKWKGESDEKPIMLMAHQDVVEATGEWEHDPFGGEIIDGKLFGRGSADIKCTLMAFMQAIEEMLEEGITPKQDIYISSSNTEEIGGEGCPKIIAELKKRGVKPWLVLDEGGAIVTEPIGGCSGNFAMIGVVEKGQGNLEFTARSNGGHSSYPGKNSPIARLSKFVVDVEKHYPLKSVFFTQAKAMFSQMAPYGPFYMRLLFGNFWCFEPLLKALLPSVSPQAAAMIRTTVAFTVQSGSNGYNVMPQEAKLVANLRYAPHQGREESNAILKKIAAKYDLEMKVLDGYDCCPTVDIEGDGYQYVKKTVNEVFPGLPTCPYVMTGGTDARNYSDFVANCIRFSPVLFGKEQMKGMHGLNECMEIKCLPQAVDFFKALIRNV